MKKVSGAACPERHNGRTFGAVAEEETSTKYTNALSHKKVSTTSAEVISEEDILIGCPRCDIHTRLWTYKLRVRDGKMRRVVVDGMPFYIGMEAAL